MIRQQALGATCMVQLRTVVGLVRSGLITLGGNEPNHIYGTLDCRAGKRMNIRNRVFFIDEADAQAVGFRPCAVCLPDGYRKWRQQNGQADERHHKKAKSAVSLCQHKPPFSR